MTLLEVRDLHTTFDTEEGLVRAVDGVSFTLDAAQTLGLVGESGCGKSATAMSIMGLIRRPGRVASGEILLDGRDLTREAASEWRKVRGKQIGMIFQEPMTSLNPVLKIGDQIAETLRLHEGLSASAAHGRAVELLELVGIPSPAERAGEYPHRLSGGMRQRVMIAMALACDPRLLIADEPTTALDVTVQAQILELLRDLQSELGMAILLITHDLGVVAEMCAEVAVMYAGRIVEQGTWPDLHARPDHPYTQGLLRAVPGPDVPRGQRLAVIPGEVPDPREWPDGCRFAPRCGLRIERCVEDDPVLASHEGPTGDERRRVACHRAGERVPELEITETSPTSEQPPHGRTQQGQSPLLEATDLVTHLPVGRGWFGRPRAVVRAVDGVSLTLQPGETLGLVGESGSGKSTLARSLLRLIPHTSGQIRFEGRDISDLPERQLRPLRPGMQMVFQDPAASLNPRLRVDQIVGEALRVHGIGGDDPDARIAAVLQRVGLRPEHARRYPHEFSGGQRQRIGIARAVVCEPRLIVADEPVSALDVSVQSQVLNLMAELRDELGVAYLFIAHNLHVVRHVSDRIAVMYLGRLVEQGRTDQIMSDPRHPYTRALLEAVPDPDPAKVSPHSPLSGEVPSPMAPPAGCRFRTRCPLARAKGTADALCKDEVPPLRELAPGHEVACHFADE